MNQPADPAAFEIIGSWKLVENSLWRNGVLTDPHYIGVNPSGFIFYLPDNRVSVIIARADRPAMSAGRHDVPASERAEAWSGLNAYAGTYTRTGARVVHHIEINSYQNDVGTDYVRDISVIDGDLVLSTPSHHENGHTVMFKLRWRRL